MVKLPLTLQNKVIYDRGMRRRIPPCATALFFVACTRQNNLLLGRVESNVGQHTVVVTDCYRTSPPGPERVDGGAYHYMPCRDAEVWIRAAKGGEELTVNGKSYGRLNPGDGVLVDHGVVSIQRNQAR
jgi:hypothetical protein